MFELIGKRSKNKSKRTRRHSHWSACTTREYAASQDRALITLNRKHFVKLHKAKPKHFGIIVCTVDTDFHAQASRINTAILNASLAGALIRVNRSA